MEEFLGDNVLTLRASLLRHRLDESITPCAFCRLLVSLGFVDRTPEHSPYGQEPNAA